MQWTEEEVSTAFVERAVAREREQPVSRQTSSGRMLVYGTLRLPKRFDKGS